MKTLDDKANFRLFHEEKERVKRVVKYAKDQYGQKKYDNEGHFFRCATIRLIKHELHSEKNGGKIK